MTRDNVSRALGKTPELVPTFDHVRHVVDRRVGRCGIHVLVKVQGVGGEDHGATPGVYPHALHSHGMAANKVHRDTGGDGFLPVMELHAAIVDAPHQTEHVLDGERTAKETLTHATAGGELHLLVLDMKRRSRKIIQAAGMIPVQVADDDVRYLVGFDAHHRQGFTRRHIEGATTTVRLLLVEAGIQHDGTLAVA